MHLENFSFSTELPQAVRGNTFVITFQLPPIFTWDVAFEKNSVSK